MQNMKKTPIEIPVYLFFHNIGPILPQRPYPLYFFLADFKLNMLGDSINFNYFVCNPVAIQLKIVFLDQVCTKKGLLWDFPRMKNNFFLQK